MITTKCSFFLACKHLPLSAQHKVQLTLMGLGIWKVFSLKLMPALDKNSVDQINAIYLRGA